MAITLTLPDDEQHSGRQLTFGIVESVEGHSVSFTDGTGCSVPEDVLPRIKEGELFGIETKGPLIGGRICGWWEDKTTAVRRETDADLERAHRETVERYEREHQEMLDANREDWQRREDALPDWIKARLQYFHDKGGKNFERDGWGYELVIAELAVLYDRDPNFGPRETYPYEDEAAEIGEYAEREGTSGNQHDCARALVLMHRQGKDLAGTIGGLSPLTGDAFYEGKS